MKKIIILILLLMVQTVSAEELKLYTITSNEDGVFSICICDEKQILKDFKKLELTEEEKQKIKIWEEQKRTKVTIAIFILEDRNNCEIKQEFIDTEKSFNICIYEK